MIIFLLIAFTIPTTTYFICKDTSAYCGSTRCPLPERMKRDTR